MIANGNWQRGIFRYPGGKSRTRVRTKILSKAPLGFQEYREPFVGGGGIFFYIGPDKKRWINDINPGLVSVYREFHDTPNAFIQRCREIEAAQDGEPLASAKGGKKLYSARLKRVFNEMIERHDLDPALSYFFLNRTTWDGRVNYDQIPRFYYSNPAGWNITQGQALENAANHIKGTRITCGDYMPLLEEPGAEVWIYLDPPYWSNSEANEQSRLYEDCFDPEDHEHLHDAVKKCKHKITLSYDDDEDGIIRDLYSDFNIYETGWTYSGTYSPPGTKKKKGKELIITNFKEESEIQGLVFPHSAISERLVPFPFKLSCFSSVVPS